jgi:3-dehydroquinate synthase
MRTIEAKYLNANVQVYLENGLISKITKFIDPNRHYYIISDVNVSSLYLDVVIKQLSNFDLYIVPFGELSKNYHEVESIITQMLAANVQKSDCMIALGGGVIGDLTGFIASIYKRGIDYISIPTSLIAQVDSCLGGKCGIDFSLNSSILKNQLGTIHHPKAIFVDPLVLKTLPKVEFSSGIGEVIKYGLCFDKNMLESIQSDFLIDDIIYQCLTIKAKITMEDEFDTNNRLILNYGHTIGHALESVSQFSLSNGQAIAIGMYYETPNESVRKYLRLLYEKFHIEIEFMFIFEDIIQFIQQDKKIFNEDIKVPILQEIGHVEIKTMSLDDYLRGLQ